MHQEERLQQPLVNLQQGTLRIKTQSCYGIAVHSPTQQKEMTKRLNYLTQNPALERKMANIQLQGFRQTVVAIHCSVANIIQQKVLIHSAHICGQNLRTYRCV